jgi:putative ABC transport system ATP-binding protein
MEIRVKDLIRVYRLGDVEVQALRGLSVTIKEGEMVSIIGPSGSGKTTLLNIIGGLDQATAGTVQVGDINVTSLGLSKLVDFRRQTVGHIFQSLNLIPTLSAAENIELAMMALGAPRGSRHEKVKQLLDVVGLSERGKHKPDELSGGEQQRVAIAAALANDAPVLLADEPTGELDSANAKIIVDYLLKVNQELGKTVVMVTHDSTVARAANRILKIEDGSIKAKLTPAQTMAEDTGDAYVNQVRARLDEIDEQLVNIDEDFKAGKIDGDEYVERRQVLKQTRNGLIEELHRMGIIN